MAEIERGIHSQQVPDDVSLLTPKQDSDQHVRGDDPAIRVMTNFKVIKPFQIEAGASLANINDKMIACGVRLLFVHDAQEKLIGLITANDILGEKPLLFVTNKGGSRDEITAHDMMTPLSELEAIPLHQVEKAQVSDVVEALKECGRHHMLVLENKKGNNFLRGIFSITQLSNQLGVEINPSERATSFAQLNKALGN